MIDSTKWQYIRQLALERDNYTCTQCGNPGRIVHHKDESGQLPYYQSPNNNSENLITVCGSCHPKLHKKRDFLFDRVYY